LTEESKTNDLQDIMIANKSKVQVVTSGNVSITIIVGKHKYNVLVKDVLYVPQLIANLLSVNQLIKNGNEVKFESNGCRIYSKQGQLIELRI